MKAMTDSVFEDLGRWMEAVTQTLYVFFCKQSTVTSALIPRGFSVELPLNNRFAEVLDNMCTEVKR